MNGTLPLEPPTSIEETTNQWKGERWHSANENDNNNIIVIVDDDDDADDNAPDHNETVVGADTENLITNGDDNVQIIKIIKVKDHNQRKSSQIDELMISSSNSFYKNLNQQNGDSSDFIGRQQQHNDIMNGHCNGDDYDDEDEGNVDDDGEEIEEEEEEEQEYDDEDMVNHHHAQEHHHHELDNDEEDEDDENINRDDEEYICEYYSDGDGGDDKQEILKRNHGDGIIAKLLVGWY